MNVTWLSIKISHMLNITRNFRTGDLQLKVAWTCSKFQLLDLVINYVFEDQTAERCFGHAQTFMPLDLIIIM